MGFFAYASVGFAQNQQAKAKPMDRTSLQEMRRADAQPLQSDGAARLQKPSASARSAAAAAELLASDAARSIYHRQIAGNNSQGRSQAEELSQNQTLEQALPHKIEWHYWPETGVFVLNGQGLVYRGQCRNSACKLDQALEGQTWQDFQLNCQEKTCQWQTPQGVLTWQLKP